MTFLGYEAGRKAIDYLIEFEPTAAANTLTNIGVSSHLRTAIGAPKCRFAPRTGTKDALLPFDLWSEGCPRDGARAQGWWVLLSCTLGPCLTWLFFYGERQRKQAKDRRMPVGGEFVISNRNHGQGSVLC